MDDNRMKKLEDEDLESVSGGGFNSLDDINNNMVDFDSICSSTGNRHKWEKLCGKLFECQNCGCYATGSFLCAGGDNGGRTMNLLNLAIRQ